MQWLYEARKKHHLIILNYMVTSDHTHLPVGSRASGRKIIEKGHSFQIREETEFYNPLFDGKKGNIAPENTFFWQQDAR